VSAGGGSAYRSVMTVAAGPGSYTVEFAEDASAFLAAAGDHLALDPVLSTVVSTVAHRTVAAQAANTEPPPHPRWFAVVRDIDGAVAGVAMRTAPFPPHPLFLLPMPDDAALALARAAHERGEPVQGANGALPASRVFAHEIARLSGGTARIDEHTRLFELGDLVEPRNPPGRLRVAQLGDADLVLEWFNAFGADAAEQAGRGGQRPAFHTPEDVAERIDGGRVWIWEDEQGVPVHLTGHSLPAYGVSRIGPVYTAREHRGRGYASAAVAQVSQMLRDKGTRICLFTDQANPTSNGIYEALGYRPVVDMANLLIS
jgi:GNAT superfamily N-acetyltransferase